MASRLATLLDQRLTNPASWRQKVAVGTDYFDRLVEDDLTEIDRIRDLLKRYSRRFREDQENRPLWKEFSQFEHACKLLLAAEMIKDHSFDFGKSRLTVGGRNELHSLLRDNAQKYSEVFEVSVDLPPIETGSLFALLTTSKKLKWISVPFATAPRTPDTPGLIRRLKLARVASWGAVGRDPRFFPNMGGRFGEIKAEFQEAIATAFRMVRETLRGSWNPNEIEQAGVVWDVEPWNQTATVEDATLLGGESVGLAAAVGIHHLLNDKVPDERILYSAKIVGNTVSDFEIDGVRTIRSKVNAAIESGFIDTFVLHKSNLRGCELSHHKGANNVQFNVKVLNSQGEEIDEILTYYKVTEGPVP